MTTTTNSIWKSLQQILLTTHHRVPNNFSFNLRKTLGLSGHLSSKYPTSDSSLHQARLEFLGETKSPCTRGQIRQLENRPQRKEEVEDEESIWVADCGFEELCDVMGRSWAGTAQIQGEPSKEWMTSHVDYPNQETKVLLSTYYMGSSIAQAMRTNSVVLGRRTAQDGRITSVLIVSEHSHCNAVQKEEGEKDRNYHDSIRDFWWELGVTFRLASLSLPDLFGCKTYQQQQSQSARKAAALGLLKQGYHDKHENKPRGTYWNVQMVAVHPHYQGKGHGRELLQRLVVLADRAQIPLYLEAAGEKNQEFYGRAGFHKQTQLHVLDPTDKQGLPLSVAMMMRTPSAIV